MATRGTTDTSANPTTPKAKNDGAIVAMGGNIKNASQRQNVTSAPTYTTLATGRPAGVTVPLPDTNARIATGNTKQSTSPLGCTYQPYSSGPFAYSPDSNDNFMIMGQTTKICGVANTNLKFLAADGGQRKKVNSVEKLTTTDYGAFDYASGIAIGPTTLGYWLCGSGASPGDSEARVNRLVPGEFCINIGGGKDAVPTYKNYARKTG